MKSWKVLYVSQIRPLNLSQPLLGPDCPGTVAKEKGSDTRFKPTALPSPARGTPPSPCPVPACITGWGKGVTEAGGWGGDSSLRGPWPPTRKLPGGSGTKVGRGPLSVLGKGLQGGGEDGLFQKEQGKKAEPATPRRKRAGPRGDRPSGGSWRIPRVWRRSPTPGVGGARDCLPSGVRRRFSRGGCRTVLSLARLQRRGWQDPAAVARPRGTFILGISTRDFKNSLADV